MVVANSTMWLPGIDRGNPLARGLIAHWPIWEGSGNATVGDVANPNPKALRGTLTSMDPRKAWVPSGKRGLPWALETNTGGETNNVIVFSGSIQTYNALTIVIDFEWNAASSHGFGRMFQWSDGQDHEVVAANTKYRFRWAAAFQDSADNYLITGEFHQYAITYDLATVRFYRDGTLFSAHAFVQAAESWYLKYYCNRVSADRPLAGRTSTLSIFNRPLLPNEIQLLHRDPMALVRRRAKALATAVVVGNPWYYYAQEGAAA